MLCLYSSSVPAHSCEGCVRRLPRLFLERFRAKNSVFLRVCARHPLAAGNTLEALSSKSYRGAVQASYDACCGIHASGIAHSRRERRRRGCRGVGAAYSVSTIRATTA